MDDLKKKDDDKDIKEQESEVINLFGREYLLLTQPIYLYMSIL